MAQRKIEDCYDLKGASEHPLNTSLSIAFTLRTEAALEGYENRRSNERTEHLQLASLSEVRMSYPATA